METVRSPYHLPPRARFPMPWPGIGQLVAAVLVLGMATLIAGSAGGQIGPAVIPLILLTSVLVNAAAFGFWTGVLSALGAFCLFSFFFIEPRHSFFTSRPQDLLMLAVMLVCAGLSGLMAGRMREQVEAAEGRADVLEVLSAATFDLSSATDEATVLARAAAHVARLTLGPAVILRAVPERTGRTRSGPEGTAVVVAVPAAFRPGAMELQAADQALTRGTTEFASSDDRNGSGLTFLPFGPGPGRGAALTIGHRPLAAARRDTPDREQAVRDILHQAGTALERLALARKAEAERIAGERQMLRSTLLASLSHDLRTPIATILGSLSTLREFRRNLSADAQLDLVAAAEEEAERLKTYVERLLQITRLMNGGTVTLHRVAPADCARAAVARARRAFPGRTLSADIADLPLVEADASLIEQAVFGLTENALRYTPGAVSIAAGLRPDAVEITVSDEGPGLSAEIRAWLATPDLLRPGEGSGLGLPIAKGIARTLGGRIEAAAGRAAISLVLPLPAGTDPSAPKTKTAS